MIARQRWHGLALLAMAAGLALSVAHAAGVGERIYRKGILPSGAPVQAERGDGVALDASGVACVNCHKRSGLGTKEGQRAIPPVAGIYLFQPRATNGDDLDLPFVESMKADRDPYTEATAARAIREGVGADGKPLNYLMPRYNLDDAQLADVVAYLKQLSPSGVAGVTDTVLHFATILTPDADPVVSKGVVDVLTQFFDDKNHYTRAQAPRMRSSHRMMFKVNRHWELHVWQLKGAPETWEAQLRAKLAAEPVFAVISGVGGRSWAPVQRFCESQALPCLFPNMDLPVDAESDFDTLYFSRGVLLEAQLIAQDIRARRASAPARRVLQLYRGADIGKDAAAALGAALRKADVPAIDVVLGAGPARRELDAALSKAQAGDTIVLWLRPGDVAQLGATPAGVQRVYLSARMGGAENAPLAPSWRAVAQMAFPYNLPDLRRVQLDYPLGWFRMRHVAVVAEQAQSDTYLACTILSDTLNHMVDTFVRDYLIERIEDMLEHRILTGYYPRLSLAPGQRFASKGGYLVHFADATGTRVVADGGWTVP